MMHFAFHYQQRELAAAVRRVLNADPLRQPAQAGAAGRRGILWRRLTDLGLFGLLVPESAGGLGMDEVDCVLVLEELGRGAVPGPVAETFFIAAPVLAAGPDGGSRWLARLGAGELAVSAGADYFPDGDVADFLLIVGAHAVELVDVGDTKLVPQPGLDPTRLPVSLAARAPRSVLGERELAAQACDRGALSSAAQLLGAAQHVLDVTVSYAASRSQFGRPIGSYQAVKHHLANVAVSLEFARPLVYRAAYAMAHSTATVSLDASAAKVAAAEAAELAARVALQVHGAIGYTEELDLQVWLKRIWSLVVSWGDATEHRARVADALLSDGAGPEAVQTPG